jgi:hypothetical protein
MSHYVSGNAVKNLKGHNALIHLLLLGSAFVLLGGGLLLLGVATQKKGNPTGFLCPHVEGVAHGAMIRGRIKKGRVVSQDRYWINQIEVSRAEFMKCYLVDLPHP